jgi:ferredoxin
MVDISLSALRMGAREVSIVCLEKRHEMPAALEEIEEAEAEGIKLRPGLGPNRIVGENGKVTALETLDTKWVFDAQGKFNPAFEAGSERRLECDTIIMAIGQAPKLDFLQPEDGVRVSPRGLIAVDRGTLMTSSAGVFAGGDCVFGPRLIIDSVGDGKRAAMAIDEFIRGERHPEPQVEVEVLHRHAMFPDFVDILRQTVPMLPLDRRTGVTEVEVGYDQDSAMAEARRCLRCYINTIFEGSEVDGSECVLCGGCVDVCPEDCLELVPLSQLQIEPAALTAIQAEPQMFDFELDDVEAGELGRITGSAMIKDETRCIRCGLCAARCPVGTITMEAFNLVPVEPSGLIPIQAMDLRAVAAQGA